MQIGCLNTGAGNARRVARPAPTPGIHGAFPAARPNLEKYETT